MSTKPSRTHVLIGSKNIRDAIIASVRQNYKREGFTEPFVAHLSKMDKKSLDEFSQLEFILSDVRLVFKTSRVEKNEMAYSAYDLYSDPDPALMVRPSRWWPF